MSREPTCCGDPMILYPWVAWECQAAFNALQEAEVIDDIGATPPIIDDRAEPWHRELHAHLLATRLPVLADTRDEAASPIHAHIDREVSKENPA